MTAPAFDRERWQREQIRNLRAEVESLSSQRTRLERILAVTLQVATARTGVEPLALLAVLEDIDANVLASQRKEAA